MQRSASSSNCQIDFIPPALRVNDYNEIADVYGEAMGDDCAAITCDLLFRTVMPRLPTDHRLRHLDLACGSGAVLADVAARAGAEAFGVDLSIRQVENARARLLKARLPATVEVGNVLDCKLPVECDLVTMTLDALNHLRNPEDWEQLFERVYGVIRDGGIFWFDVNTPERLLNDWAYPEVILKERCTYVQCPIGEAVVGDVVRRSILMQIFTQQGLVVSKFCALIEQTALATEKILGMLHRAGFVAATIARQRSTAVEEHIFMKNRKFVCASKRGTH